MKSPAEIAYVRRAAALATPRCSKQSRSPASAPGKTISYAALQGSILRADGDYPGNEFVIGSGSAAGVGRYASGRRRVGEDDSLLIEFAGVFRHYHLCLMRTFRGGTPEAARRDVRGGARGVAPSAALRRHRRRCFRRACARLREGGLRLADNRVNACGYSLGTTFSPNWMDWPMVYRDNPVVIEPGMVLFLHMVLTEAPRNVAPGETFLVTDIGSERLGKAPLTLAPSLV